jgi:AcrR family transcriptional regulator
MRVHTDEAPRTAPRGRPRDSAATALIRKTALDIVEQVGFEGLSIEAVAARAGVAKTTIYRRWPNVWAVLMEAFLADVTRLAPIELRGTARASIAESLRGVARAFRGRQGKVLRLLIGRAQTEAELAEAFWTRWVEPRRVLAREVLRRGVEAGELRPGIDIEASIDALYSPLYYRLLIPYAPLSEQYIDALVDGVFGGLQHADGAGARLLVPDDGAAALPAAPEKARRRSVG